MAVLTEAGLLATWETGLGQGRVLRALTLATAGGADAAEVVDYSVGRREGFVLALREDCFGGVFPCAVDCPSCAEELELELGIEELRPEPPTVPARITVDGTDVEFRPITSRDLLAVGPTAPDARGRLLGRCVLGARRRGREVPFEKLPDDVLDALSAGLSTQDPQADVVLELDCASCGHEWTAPFDITSYLWAEMDAYARRLLHDVHVLATAYGWSEDEVLAVSPARRSHYLEMAAT